MSEIKNIIVDLTETILQIRQLKLELNTNNSMTDILERLNPLVSELNLLCKQQTEILPDITKLIENHEGLVWIKDLVGKYLAVNNTYATYYSKTDKNYFVGKTDYDLYDTKDADIFRSHDIRLIKTGIPFSIEEEIVLPDRNIFAKTYKAPLFNAENKIIGTIGFVHDLTKQRQLEQQNKKLLQAIEQSSTTIVITDKNAVIEYVNPQFEAITGYSIDEAIGKNPGILNSGLTPKEVIAEMWQTILSGKVWHGEFCNKKKNQELFWETAVISPVFDSKAEIVNFIAIKDDITAFKNAQKELIRMSRFQDLLIEISMQNIHPDITTLKTNIENSLMKISKFVEADRALIFIYDWENSSCFAQYEWFSEDFESIIDSLKSVDFNMIKPWINKHLLKEIFYIPYLPEYDGESNEELKARNLQTMISVPFFIKDNCVGFISFDSVKKKHLYTEKEKSLLIIFGQIYASLLQRNELENSLKNEIENVRKANEAKSEFLANMSHELRTPLNGVIGFSELLMQTNVSDVQLQYTSAINTSAKSLLKVINDILDFSKIEAGKMELEITKSDVVQMIEQSIDIVKFSAEKKGVELLLNIPEYLPRFAYIDSFRVSQIIINLLNNAVKFTNEGEVELKVSFTEIDLDKGIYTFSVRDTGIGISDEQKLKLFKAFSQADTSTTRKFGGTGLGLSISEKLAQKMGGSIQFESELGKGSTFNFSVNVHFESESSVFNEKIENITKVLVIDDNLNSRIIIQKMLINWGIETVICESASEAIFIMQLGTDFDLIIVDNNMNDNTAIESIQFICKKLNITVQSQNFLVIQSSTNSLQFYDKCKLVGIKYMIEKPFRYDDIFHYLKNINNPEQVDKVILEVKTEDSKIPERKFRILIADDDIFNMMLAKAMIANIIKDVEFTESANGKMAYEQIVKNKYDLVFMDVQMPEMDGNEATKLIREFESKSDYHTIIIGLTAGALKEEREKCLESGMDEFLTKPIDTEKLKETVSRYLNTK